MIMKIIKLSEKGQIALPTEIRKEMDLKKGDELVIFELGNRIMIQKKEKVAEKIEDDFKDWKELAKISLQKAWDDEEDNEHWESYLKK